MTMAIPAQEFQIGQRVRDKGGASFTIQSIYLSNNGRIKYAGAERGFYVADELTLAPERPPYVPSERKVVYRHISLEVSNLYRCESDTEMAVRHAIERAEYEQQDATDSVIYNASGQPIGITGRTGQPGQPGRPSPGAA